MGRQFDGAARGRNSHGTTAAGPGLGSWSRSSSERWLCPFDGAGRERCRVVVGQQSLRAARRGRCGFTGPRSSASATPDGDDCERLVLFFGRRRSRACVVVGQELSRPVGPRYEWRTAATGRGSGPRRHSICRGRAPTRRGSGRRRSGVVLGGERLRSGWRGTQRSGHAFRVASRGSDRRERRSGGDVPAAVRPDRTVRSLSELLPPVAAA